MLLTSRQERNNIWYKCEYIKMPQEFLKILTVESLSFLIPFLILCGPSPCPHPAAAPWPPPPPS